MSKLKLLSVNELHGFSDRIGTEFTEFVPESSYTDRDRLITTRITVHANRSIVIRQIEDGPGVTLPESIVIRKCDIDTLIEFLQEAKTFVSEEEMVAKLIGKKC